MFFLWPVTTDAWFWVLTSLWPCSANRHNCTRGQQHLQNLISTLLSRGTNLQQAMCYLFPLWTYKWTLLQFKSQVKPGCRKNRHPLFISKIVWSHYWPVSLVSCWKSRFCSEVRAVALCNHVHTQVWFNSTLEGKIEGLNGFYFKVPFQAKLAAQAIIQILLVLQAKRLVFIIHMSTCWLCSHDFYLPS